MTTPDSDTRLFDINEFAPEVSAADPAAIAVGQVVEVDPAVGASNARVAFGRFVKPEMYDVFGDYDLSSLSQAEIEWMKPETLGGLLFEQESTTPYSVKGIALNATEYGMLARHPQRLAEAAEQKSLKDKDLDNTVIATGKRAEIHALENKADVMNSHITKLVHQRALLKELAREAKQPGYAHKSAQRMKELTSAAWVEFTGMLDVVHLQRDWDDDTRKRAETALINYLTQGSQRDRIGHWQGMIQLADGYLGARVHLFRGRAKETISLLETRNAQYSARFA